MAVAETSELAAFRKQAVDEWKTYVAHGAIDIDGARAFNHGDPVPASHVARGIVREDQVRLREASAATLRAVE